MTTLEINSASAEKYCRQGFWKNRTIYDFFTKILEKMPQKTAVVDKAHRLSFLDIELLSENLAGSLQDLGVGRGDVVSFQLPNWYHTLVINMAITKLGAVINPIIPIYREREVSFILKQANSAVMIIPDIFRGHNYVEMLERIRPGVPNLKHVVILGEHVAADMISLQEMMREKKSPRQHQKLNPQEVKLLMYTSGTTSDPKGVQHTHNTLISENLNVSDFWGIEEDDVIFMPSPVTHVTGYLYALELPFILGNKVVLMDAWDPEDALDLFEKEKCTLTVGATPFLQGLLQSAASKKRDIGSLTFVCGGAAVPPELIKQARNKHGWKAFKVYGLTEAPTITAGVRPGTSTEKAAETDGMVFGNEVKIVDNNHRRVSFGEEGEIAVKGPEVFVGYKDPNLNQDHFDAEGWFFTGDLGSLTSEGYLKVKGRIKDIIIRGGENISAKEIEDLLYTDSRIESAAVVAMPDERMGEKACAYVKLAQGESFTFEEMINLLMQFELAKQKLPERLEIIDEFPQTPSGKIKKNVLRKDIAEKLGLLPPLI